jgi:DNA-binding transcriptional MerR regulator
VLDAEDVAAAVRKLDRDSKVSESTVHYYTQAGILPPAIGRGPHSYTPEHVALFRLARRLRRSGLGLGDIRKRVSSLSREQIASALGNSGGEGRSTRNPARPLHGPSGHKGRSSKVRKGTSLRANAPASDPLVAEALRALPGKLPRTLRFPQGYSLSCPPEASDALIATLYATIQNVLRDDVGRPVSLP